MSKVTGQANSFTYNGNTVYTTKVTPKVERKMADSTDTGNYDPTSGLIHKSQLPVTTQTTIDFEGFYYTDTTNAQVLADLYAATAARPVVVKINGTNTLGHGNADLTSLEVGIVADDIVTVKGTLMSNGVWTPGS
jgi:hypothetical protein